MHRRRKTAATTTAASSGVDVDIGIGGCCDVGIVVPRDVIALADQPLTGMRQGSGRRGMRRR